MPFVKGQSGNPDTQFKPGESGNPAGKPKGTKHLSTIIREVGENIDWNKTTLKNKDQLKEMYGNNGWVAICYVAMTKAMAGDPQAMRWLAENGYGKNIDITSQGEKVVPILGGLTTLTPEQIEEIEKETFPDGEIRQD